MAFMNAGSEGTIVDRDAKIPVVSSAEALPRERIHHWKTGD